ncbi:MAG: ABC transporter permease [Ferruginibacter sp.]
MIPINLKSAFRQLWKNRLFSMVNIIGLSAGLASVMALLAGVYLYSTTDDMHRDKDRMYYLKTTGADGNEFTQTTYPLLDEILKTCPEVEAGTHAQHWSNPWLKYGEKELQENTMYVDTGFFRVFSFPLKYGNASRALNDKFSVVISDKVAIQLFGKTDPVGQTVFADDTVQLTVTGVLETIPANSTVHAEIFLTTALLKSNPNFVSNANWYNGFALNFIKLLPGKSINALDSKIAKLVALNYAPTRKTDKVKAVPFTNMRNEAGPVINIIIKGSVGTAIFILLIVLVNLLNLNTAIMYTRSREVAVRQIMGSGKANIIKQFCLENALIVFLSLILGGLIFINILLPQLNTMYGSRFGEVSLSPGKDYLFVLVFIVIGIILTIAAGTLPALKLLSVRVSDGVKGKIIKAGGNHRIRNIFIAFQFTLAIIFICITIILNRQIDFMKNASPGFNKDDIAVVSLDLAFKNTDVARAHFETILNDLRTKPFIKSVSTNSVIPTAYWDNFNNYIDPATNKEVTLRHTSADAGFVTTFEIPLIEGRNFSDALTATEKKSVMINRTAMKALGWATAAGKQLREKGGDDMYTVIGVMEDFHHQDMQKGIEPLLHWYGGKQGLMGNNYLSIRAERSHIKGVLQQLQADFNAMPSRRPFKQDLMTDLVSRQYALIDGILKTTNFVALLTIIISCMGMFGLISLFAKQRVKEIGIRKVLGAQVSQIVLLLAKDFSRLIMIACIIAFPVAWFAMDSWLQSFANRISIQWWMFVLAGCFALLIAFFTIGFQAVKAALANPVNSLRTE